ncbi:Gfo/Idh/MocA family protein [Brevibacillus sp. NRS-1366]|uniref:Gfo/Idh/MocA family protein n=1 Tax=Brevibacillus sp. NRS-1366 TaxID=3233899 RepID=UPI003D1E981A
MPILVIGLGSMGKRRIRDLLALQEREVTGWDPRDDRRKEAEQRFGIRTFSSLVAAMQESIYAIVISTPPDTHMQYAHIAADRKIPFFTEASVTSDGIASLIEKLSATPELIAAPSCTMMFHPAVSIIHDLVKRKAVGEKMFFHYHSGQYLPDWHPYEDYRTYYVSKKETGGCREIVPFEWMWITSIFGPIRGLSAAIGKVSQLDAEIDDVYQMIVSLSDGTRGQITIDVVSRIPTRRFVLIGEEGTITWDFFSRDVILYTGSGKRTTTIAVLHEGRPFHYEDMYCSEMKAFLAAIEGRPFPHDYVRDLSLLKTLEQMEREAIL